LSVTDEIKARLAALAPESIDIIDESSLHAGHEGAKSGGGHYRLTIVSLQFHGLTLPGRHRMVYDALGPMMHKQIHALAIKACTPEEF
jgi:BolA protein